MKINFIAEPLLEFSHDKHICPRFGVANFQVYDNQQYLIDTKPKEVVLGVIGTQQNFDNFESWVKICGDFIEEKKSNQPNLFPSFCGFNSYTGFQAKIICNNNYFRQINDSDINKAIKEAKKFKNYEDVKKRIADLYLTHIEFFADNKNKRPDVIICVIPNNLYEKILKYEKEEEEENEIEAGTDVKEDLDIEINFRSYLKANSMKYRVPLQLIRESSLTTEQPKGKGTLQDLATRAWNFCTALYYKAGGIPWKADIKNDYLTCYVGISFYKSLDKKTLQTSLAQVFDEQGKGVILRGNPVEIDKNDRQPHLNEEQAYELLTNALKGYKDAEGTYPKRVVVHKSSKYTEQETNGFLKAIEEQEISTFDFITIFESDIRLYRSGKYPPLRGTYLELDKSQFLMYTKGSVEYYQTYAGMYIPQPIEIRIAEINSSPNLICEEVLALTKMNWNKTQFDGKMPITIDCSRSVGKIMKYIDANDTPSKKYGFYM